MTVVILALAASYGLAALITRGDMRFQPVTFGCDDPDVWSAELHGPALRLIDGGRS